MTATNYAVAPGEYLTEWPDEQDFSGHSAADLMGCSREQFNDIINGRAIITDDTANRLEHVTGIPAVAWLRYEAAYRADLARIAAESTDTEGELVALLTGHCPDEFA